MNAPEPVFPARSPGRDLGRLWLALAVLGVAALFAAAFALPHLDGSRAESLRNQHQATGTRTPPPVPETGKVVDWRDVR